MTERNRNLLRFYFGIALAVMTAVVAALFIWQILDIYFSGHAPEYNGDVFSREIVGEHFGKIAPAFWIWIVMIAAGAVIWIIFPEEKKRKPYSDPVYALNRLDKRITAADYGEELNKSLEIVKREKLIIAILWLGVALFCTAGAIFTIVYLATPSHFFKQDITGEMLNMVKNVLPFAAVALILGCAVTVYEGFSAKKQLPHAKQLAAASRGAVQKPLSKPQIIVATVKRIVNHKYFILGVRIALGCFGVAFVIAGIFNDSMRNVLIKAINICTECIGLG